MWPDKPGSTFNFMRYCLGSEMMCFRWKWSNFMRDGHELQHVQPPPPINMGGGEGYIGITLPGCPSVCPSLCVSYFVRTISPAPLNHFLTKLGMMVYYHEVECHAEKSVHCLQCQSKYDYFNYIFQTAGLFATKLGLIVLHHNLECPVGKIGLQHSRLRSQWRSKCQWMFWWYLLNYRMFCCQTWCVDAAP